MLHHTSGVCVSSLCLALMLFFATILIGPTAVAVVTSAVETITAKHSGNASRCSLVVPVVGALFDSAGAFVATLLC